MKTRIAVALYVLAACGSTGDDIARSGVPDLAVNALSAEDALKLCQWMAPTLNQAVDRDLLCLRTALLAAQTKEECEASRATCLAEMPAQTVACADITGFHASCTALVSQLEVCLSDGREQTTELKKTLSCDYVGKPYDGDNPASCANIMPECFPAS